MRKQKQEQKQIHVWNIRLTKDCRKSLRKTKDCIWGTVADAIEYGDWYIPVEDYLHSHIKSNLEKSMVDFFHLRGNKTVEIDSFMTNIIEYDGNE